MDPTEQLIPNLLANVVVRHGTRITKVGDRLSRAHVAFHSALHSPMRRDLSLWCQLAYLNYTVFFGFGLCARILTELSVLDATIAANEEDILRRMLRPAMIDAFTARLGAALDSLASVAFGVVSTQEPLARNDIHFSGAFAWEKFCKHFNRSQRTGAQAAAFTSTLTKQFRSAQRDLEAFIQYRNKIVHTVVLPRRAVRKDGRLELHMVRLARLFPPGKPFDTQAFVRVYGTTNPVYRDSGPPTASQRPSDFQRQPITEQLSHYHALAVKHAGLIPKTIQRAYEQLVRPGFPPAPKQ